MRNVKALAFVFIAAVSVFASQSVRADEFDQEMVLKFSGPVEVPGIVLPAGTYTFKLADSFSSSNVVEILNDDGSRVYATLLTIPDERSTPTYEPVVTFEERAKGSPEAIRSIFYPGSTIGMEFVYPKRS
jgi:hypothetical protein